MRNVILKARTESSEERLRFPTAVGWTLPQRLGLNKRRTNIFLTKHENLNDVKGNNYNETSLTWKPPG